MSDDDYTGFDVITPPAERHLVRMSAADRKNGVTVRINVPGEVAEAFSAQASDRFDVAIGRGNCAGWILVIKNGDGGYKATPNARGGGFRIALRDPEFAPDMGQPITDCDWCCQGLAAIRVRLPSWAYVAENDEGRGA